MFSRGYEKKCGKNLRPKETKIIFFMIIHLMKSCENFICGLIIINAPPLSSIFVVYFYHGSLISISLCLYLIFIPMYFLAHIKAPIVPPVPPWRENRFCCFSFLPSGMDLRESADTFKHKKRPRLSSKEASCVHLFAQNTNTHYANSGLCYINA